MWRKRSAVPLPAYNTPLGLSKTSLGAFQVAQIMNFFPYILPSAPYWRLGSGCRRGEQRCRKGATDRTSWATAEERRKPGCFAEEFVTSGSAIFPSGYLAVIAAGTVLLRQPARSVKLSVSGRMSAAYGN